MSARNFKPGQKAKAAPKSDAAAGRSASHRASLAQQIAELSNPTPKGSRHSASGSVRLACAQWCHAMRNGSLALFACLSARVGADFDPEDFESGAGGYKPSQAFDDDFGLEDSNKLFR